MIFVVVLALIWNETMPMAWAGSVDKPIIFFSSAPKRTIKAVSPPPPYFGDNLSSSAIKTKLIAAGQKYKIPPHVLFGIAYQESVWKQFRTDRRTTYHLEPDGRVGVGMMQMTVQPSASDYERLCTDVDYNIDRGAALLNDKWRATPTIGDNARDKIENWYYAIWAYNGFICPNPNDYAPKVLAHIGNGRALWTPVTISAPSVNNSNCSLSRIDSTPTPTHIDSNYDGIIDATISQQPTGVSLFQDNFDARTSASNWQVNTSIANTTESEVDFAYDYSQLGIPSAPRSVGGSTVGARFLVNKGTNVTTTSGNLQGISASPIGKNFSGNFKIRFDMWLNYVGSLGTGGTSTPPGSGSTQMAAAGWGTDGRSVQWSGSNHSVLFSADGDGGTAADYRAYLASPTLFSPSSGVYAAGIDADASNSSNRYYSSFGDKTAPEQAALFPSQSGTTPSGALGFAWRDVLIEKSDDTLTWSVDGKKIASVDVSGVTLGGSNLFLGLFDINATSSSADDQLNAAIFDNVSVYSASDNQGAILSEFRFRGPNGSADEYVELYNTLGVPLDISGWSIQTNTGTAASPVFRISTVPAGTIIPARGHFLFTGSSYSLTSYAPAGTSLGGDSADDSGVALFNALGVRQDAVGFKSSNASLREGAGLASTPTANGQHAFMRDFTVSIVKDSGDTTNDFVFVSTAGNTPVAGTPGALTPQLGAPNPEGLTSPSFLNDKVGTLLLDSAVSSAVAPNRVRIGSGNSGTLQIRRTLVNNTGKTLNRVRFIATRITSQGSPTIFASGQADLRLISIGNQPSVATSAGPVDVFGTTIETPTQSSPGGGLGSSVAFNAILSSPLPAGASRSYAFNVQVATAGNFLVAFNIQAITAP